MGTELAELPTPDLTGLPLGIAGGSKSHPAAVYLAGLSEGSRPTMVDSLNIAADLLSAGRANARTLPWPSLTYAEMQALRATLESRYAPATANKILSAVRGVIREAWRLELISSDSCKRITDVPSIKARVLPRSRALSPGEIADLFAACRADKFKAAGDRDAAILALLYGAGLRRSEVVNLDMADYSPATGELRIRHAKGGRDRIGHCRGGSRAALHAWLEHRGQDAGPLFVRVTQGGNVVHRRLSVDAIWHLIRKRAKQAGVAPFSPHALRHTFVTHLLDNGADIGVVQRLAGHANVQTTLRYDRRGREAEQEAADLLNIPWRSSSK